MNFNGKFEEKEWLSLLNFCYDKKNKFYYKNDAINFKKYNAKNFYRINKNLYFAQKSEIKIFSWQWMKGPRDYQIISWLIKNYCFDFDIENIVCFPFFLKFLVDFTVQRARCRNRMIFQKRRVF